MRAAFVDARFQPVTNRIRYPSLRTSTAGWAATRSTVSHPDGTYTRLTCTEAIGPTGCRLESPASRAAVDAGAQVTISASTRSLKATLLRALWYDAGGVYMGLASVSGTSSASGTWERLTLSAIVPPGAVTCSLNLANSATVVIGDVMDWRDAMLTPGPHPYAYADGDTPGWKWTGTPGQSPSVGWPRPT